VFEKRALKAKDSSAKFHWLHFRRINALESRGVCFFCTRREWWTSQIISMPTLTRWQIPAGQQLECRF
jgi:hypothetical protein